MNKKLLIIIIAVIVIAGAAGAFLLTKDDNNSEGADSNTSQNTNNSTSGNTPAFNPVATNNVPFVATMTGTTEGQTYNAKIEFDGKGNTKSTSTYQGQTAETYIIGDDYIICNAGQCFKMSAPDDSSSPVNPDEYSYSAEDFAAFKNNSTYKGKQSCPAGSCDTWEISYQGNTYTMYIGDNNRISKVAGTASGSTYEITYEYKDVSIKAPTNVQTLPAN